MAKLIVFINGWEGNNMKAVILGATGATGQEVLRLVLENPLFDSVEIFVRRNPGIKHRKLIVQVVDFEQLANWKHVITGDVLFSCLGTTRKEAGSKEQQWQVDYLYQLEVAKASKVNGVTHYILISTVMASPDSKFFYTRMKGELEEAIKALMFPKTTILQPPSLVRPHTTRWSETISTNLLSLLNKAGIWEDKKPMPTEILGKAMILAAISQPAGCETWDSQRIWNSGLAYDCLKVY